MKAVRGLRLIDVEGWEALAAFIGPNGKLSPITDCIARIAVVSDGKGVAEVLALAPPSEFLGSCLSDYDWLRRWNRLRVCHPEGSKRQAKASARIERLLARSLKEYLNDADPSAANAALKKAFGRELIKWLDTSSTEDTKFVDGRSKLEIIDMRPLDDDEQNGSRSNIRSGALQFRIPVPPRIVLRSRARPFVKKLEASGDSQGFSKVFVLPALWV